MTAIRGFASDNNAGVSPEVFQKLEEVNKGHAIGYGDDQYSEQAIQILKKHFGEQAEPYLVVTGTAANVLGLNSVVQPYHAVICANTAHLNVDECGAPERFVGCKLISVETPDGKLTPERIEKHLRGFGFEHHSQPRVISISQPTEMGTLYSADEIQSLSQMAKKYKLYLHMDGARLANAVTGLNTNFKAITTDVGIDILSFGGTKNGLMSAESVLFLQPGNNKHFKYIRKQGMQLMSKMRFVAAQFLAYFENDLWKKNASHANAMAQLLFEKVKDMEQVKVTQNVQANGIFAIIPKNVIPILQKEYFFYVWNENSGEVRWMTSFDTTEEDINGFVTLLHKYLS